MTIWLTIVGMALVTFATRVVSLLVLRREPPAWLRRWLGLVPAAVFTALVVPALLLTRVNGAMQVSLGPSVPAGIVAALVAWRSGNLVLTIIAGMGTFWLLRGML